MTMIKGQDGALNNIDLTHATTLECEECKCKGFKQTLLLRKLSALVSPNGQETLIPVVVNVGETILYNKHAQVHEYGDYVIMSVNEVLSIVED